MDRVHYEYLAASEITGTLLNRANSAAAGLKSKRNEIKHCLSVPSTWPFKKKKNISHTRSANVFTMQTVDIVRGPMRM